MIHSTAIVDPTARIADDCDIGAYSIVGADVSIESGTTVGPHVVIKGPTRIGKRNRIFQFASVGDDPQDLKYAGETTELIIGDHNTIREFTTINRGTEGGGGVTRIGNHNLFMAYIHVAHDCQLGDNIVMANGASLAGHVSVGDYAILAGFACVHQFCAVGEHAFLGLNSVANRDIAPFTMAVGNYAEGKGINKNGLRRRDFTEPAIQALHRAYKVLIRQHGERDKAIAAISTEDRACPEVARLVEFVENSERGVVR